MSETPPVLDIDPYSPELLSNPSELYALLRRHPVAFIPKYGCYAVGRYEETKTAFSDHTRFLSSFGTGLGHIGKGQSWRPPGPIVESDPPEHTKLRMTLNRILSPIVVRAWKEQFMAEGERIVARILERESFDGVRDLVEPFTLKVFPDAIGIPEDGREQLLPIGDLTTNAIGPENELTRKSLAECEPLMPWFTSLFEREAMRPGGFGAHIWAAADAGEIEMDKVKPLVRTFLRGGLDTSISGISSLLWLLAQHPAQWERLREEPGLIRNAFDEAIRLESPAQAMYRTSQGQVELRGFELEHDIKVYCSLAAANRDPRRWENPDSFDIGRKTQGHLAFGVGVHMCIGQMIARLECEAVLAPLLQNVRALELIGPAPWRPNNTARRLDRLPLRAHLA